MKDHCGICMYIHIYCIYIYIAHTHIIHIHMNTHTHMQQRHTQQVEQFKTTAVHVCIYKYNTHTDIHTYTNLHAYNTSVLNRSRN